MSPVLGKDHARPRRDSAREPHVRDSGKFPGTGRTGVSDGVGKMMNGPAGMS